MFINKFYRWSLNQEIPLIPIILAGIAVYALVNLDWILLLAVVAPASILLGEWMWIDYNKTRFKVIESGEAVVIKLGCIVGAIPFTVIPLIVYLNSTRILNAAVGFFFTVNWFGVAKCLMQATLIVIVVYFFFKFNWDIAQRRNEELYKKERNKKVRK